MDEEPPDALVSLQFLKIDGKIIPLALCGSNQIVSTEAEIMKEIKAYCDGGEYQEHFIQNGS